MMKAVLCTRYGSPNVLHLGEYPKPEPLEDEVLIRIIASSVTNSDIFLRSSKVLWRMLVPMRIMIGITKPRNKVIGEVFSGVIEKTGSKIKRFKAGDEVYGLTGMSLGAYAEYKCMKEIDSMRGCVAIKPRNISHELATSAAYGGLLAFQGIEKIKVFPNQQILVYGASSTSGLIAVQLLKYLRAEVTAVCSKGNFDFVKSLGATKVLDYRNQDDIKNLTKYSCVFDCVGIARKSDLKIATKKCLDEDGAYISIDDEALSLDSNRLNRIREMVEQGCIVPQNDRSFGLSEIVEAHEYVEKGHKRGNVSVRICD